MFLGVGIGELINIILAILLLLLLSQVLLWRVRRRKIDKEKSDRKYLTNVLLKEV